MSNGADTLRRWTIQDAAELYGIRAWGQGYFDISDRGDVVVSLRRGEKHEKAECEDESQPEKAEACGSPHG